MSLSIELVPLLKDNYAYLLRDAGSAKTAVVDPSEAKPILALLNERGWDLDFVLCTHHHWDHTGGNAALKEATGCRIVGYEGDAERIAGLDIAVTEATGFDLGEARAHILFIPGHTLGHIAYHFEAARAVFCGDTLFSLGCGRMFEGTPGQMWASLSKLGTLPEETRVYCGHEYTEANLRFAESLEPGRAALEEKRRQVARLRAEGRPTVPSTIGEERRLNPFLRADDPALAGRLNLTTAGPVKIFAELRRRKDKF